MKAVVSSGRRMRSPAGRLRALVDDLRLDQLGGLQRVGARRELTAMPAPGWPFSAADRAVVLGCRARRAPRPAAHRDAVGLGLDDDLA